MFNWRVETFNQILYLDVLSHEYAYILDSNRNLTYEYDMFSRHTGRVKDYGIKTIFKDINLILIQINEHNNHLFTNSHFTQEQTNTFTDENEEYPSQLFLA